MRRGQIVLTALALISFGVSDASAYWSFGGTGNKSCASWTSNLASNYEATMWILGFWTGLNYSDDSMAGKTTDALGVMGEIRKVCEGAPAFSIANATAHVHRLFKASGR